jgi:TrmH family RNA methyltransferase
MGLSKEKRKLLDRLRNARFRGREGQFLVEGVRGAREFLEGSIHWDFRFALVSSRLEASEEGRLIKGRLMGSDIPVEEVSDQELEQVSDTEHPQGIVMVVREEERALPPSGRSTPERVLLLDGIQDPGNAGTLLRAGRAFGLTRAVALEGSVDLFNPKVVRASAGALAHLPVHRLPWTEASFWLGTRDVPLLVGVAGGKDVRAVTVSSSWALAIGNEGAGVRPALRAAATGLVGIPMISRADSLNAGVAGAILMFALNPPPGSRTEN